MQGHKGLLASSTAFLEVKSPCGYCITFDFAQFTHWTNDGTHNQNIALPSMDFFDHVRAESRPWHVTVLEPIVSNGQPLVLEGPEKLQEL